MGSRIASGAQDPDTLLRIWNAETGKLERTDRQRPDCGNLGDRLASDEPQSHRDGEY